MDYDNEEEAKQSMSPRLAVEVLGVSEWDGKGRAHNYSFGFLLVTHTGGTYYVSVPSLKEREEWVMHFKRGLECVFANPEVMPFKPSKILQNCPPAANNSVCPRSGNLLGRSGQSHYCRSCGRVFYASEYVNENSTMLQIGGEECEKVCTDCHNCQICILYMKSINYVHAMDLHEITPMVMREITRFKTSFQFRCRLSSRLGQAATLLQENVITSSEFEELREVDHAYRRELIHDDSHRLKLALEMYGDDMQTMIDIMLNANLVDKGGRASFFQVIVKVMDIADHAPDLIDFYFPQLFQAHLLLAQVRTSIACMKVDLLQQTLLVMSQKYPALALKLAWSLLSSIGDFTEKKIISQVQYAACLSLLLQLEMVVTGGFVSSLVDVPMCKLLATVLQGALHQQQELAYELGVLFLVRRRLQERFDEEDKERELRSVQQLKQQLERDRLEKERKQQGVQSQMQNGINAAASVALAAVTELRKSFGILDPMNEVADNSENNDYGSKTAEQFESSVSSTAATMERETHAVCTPQSSSALGTSGPTCFELFYQLGVGQASTNKSDNNSSCSSSNNEDSDDSDDSLSTSLPEEDGNATITDNIVNRNNGLEKPDLTEKRDNETADENGPEIWRSVHSLKQNDGRKRDSNITKRHRKRQQEKEANNGTNDENKILHPYNGWNSFSEQLDFIHQLNELVESLRFIDRPQRTMKLKEEVVKWNRTASFDRSSVNGDKYNQKTSAGNTRENIIVVDPANVKITSMKPPLPLSSVEQMPSSQFPEKTMRRGDPVHTSEAKDTYPTGVVVAVVDSSKVINSTEGTDNVVVASPMLGWDPTTLAGEPFYRIMSIVTEECRVFRTKARAPSMIVCEVLRDDLVPYYLDIVSNRISTESIRISNSTGNLNRNSIHSSLHDTVNNSVEPDSSKSSRNSNNNEKKRADSLCLSKAVHHSVIPVPGPDEALNASEAIESNPTGNKNQDSTVQIGYSYEDATNDAIVASTSAVTGINLNGGKRERINSFVEVSRSLHDVDGLLVGSGRDMKIVTAQFEQAQQSQWKNQLHGEMKDKKQHKEVENSILTDIVPVKEDDGAAGEAPIKIPMRQPSYNGESTIDGIAELIEDKVETASNLNSDVISNRSGRTNNSSGRLSPLPLAMIPKRPSSSYLSSNRLSLSCDDVLKGGNTTTTSSSSSSISNGMINTAASPSITVRPAMLPPANITLAKKDDPYSQKQHGETRRRMLMSPSGRFHLDDVHEAAQREHFSDDCNSSDDGGNSSADTSGRTSPNIVASPTNTSSSVAESAQVVVPKPGATQVTKKVLSSAQRLLKAGKIDPMEYELLLASDQTYRDENAREEALVARSRVEDAFGETWESKKERILGDKLFMFGRPTPSLWPGWDLRCFIAKSNDDLRQEVCCLQLMQICKEVFEHFGLSQQLWLRPYRIVSTGPNTGLVQVVNNATSLDALKKSTGFTNLLGYFKKTYDTSPERFAAARLNFASSLAAYSLFSYLLLIKDRHNGNMLIDSEGHIVHIDFGFMLSIAPGGAFSIETAPFKLTEEMAELLGGLDSPLFGEFVTAFTKGFIALQANAENIISALQTLSYNSTFPCFQGKQANIIIDKLRARFRTELSVSDAVKHCLDLITNSYGHYGTRQYDTFQWYTNGIMP